MRMQRTMLTNVSHLDEFYQCFVRTALVYYTYVNNICDVLLCVSSVLQAMCYCYVTRILRVCADILGVLQPAYVNGMLGAISLFTM
jgi:hypothetical protein